MAVNTQTSKLANSRKSVIKFFKEMKSELKKVVWLTWQQLKNNTITVILACLIIGAVIWIADIFLEQLVKLILI